MAGLQLAREAMEEPAGAWTTDCSHRLERVGMNKSFNEPMGDEVENWYSETASSDFKLA